MRSHPSNSSLHGQLTNEFQNGASIARSYDGLSRPCICIETRACCPSPFLAESLRGRLSPAWCRSQMCTPRS